MQYAYGGDARYRTEVHSAVNLKELQQFLKTISLRPTTYFLKKYENLLTVKDYC